VKPLGITTGQILLSLIGGGICLLQGFTMYILGDLRNRIVRLENRTMGLKEPG
jgi:hypothetical protein